MRIPLLGSAYVGRSVIASGQRQINLIAEHNDDDPQAPTPITLYPTPGSVFYAQDPLNKKKVRCTYRTTIGTSYIIIGSQLYFLDINGILSSIGIVADRPSQVYMADNGQVAVLVDGVNGYAIDMTTNQIDRIIDPAFYGADFVVFLDTFFVFNRPGTNQFYISLSQASFGMLSNSGIGNGNIVGGLGYVNGVYSNVPLLGGSGEGATAEITIGGTNVATGIIANSGLGYVNGIYNAVPLTGGTGSGETANITVGGTGLRNGNITNAGASYTDGVYNNVPLTGGAGANAKATVTVAGGVITTVVPTSHGGGYVVGNVLSANNTDLGGTGAGFQYTITEIGGMVILVNLLGSGKDYVAGDNLSVDAANLGGVGSGFSYTVSTLGSKVAAVDIDNPGKNYIIGDILTADAANLGGSGAGFSYTITQTNTAFDPLDIAAKSGSADPIKAILAVHRELWLIGELTTEVWIGTGAADFYFQQVQGAFIDHGCAAPYSATNMDILAFWLMQDRQGHCLVMRGAGYEVKEISTPKLVKEFSDYDVISDAIGFCFQQQDHAFYCLTFPTANKTWLFDLTTGEWNEWAWTDPDGNLNRHRANCAMFFNNMNIIGDWENGKLLKLDSDVYTDEDQPITRIRTFPHITNNGDRVFYKQFAADIEVATLDDQNDEPPQISLSWSDDRGVTFGNPVMQSLGNYGNFLAQPSWNRLGMARDRVFKLQWSASIKTALNGAWIDYQQAKS